MTHEDNGPLTGRFLANRRGVKLTEDEHRLLDGAIETVRDVEARTTVIDAGVPVDNSTFLIDGVMSRYIDDSTGLRQLVAVHMPGEFVDLHAYPMKELDHSVGTITRCRLAFVPHAKLKAILIGREELERKLWFSTLLDASLHRTWLFRVGRLDAVGRIAHFLCETHARLQAVGMADGLSFSLPLTQADLAEVCGLTNVHVNRVLRQLREAGLCTFKSSVVEIIDPTGLAKRGHFDPHYLYFRDPPISG